MPILAIDTGNSRTKWGVHDGSWLAQGVVENAHIVELADALRPWIHCKQAAISNVAGEAVAGRLDDILMALGITPHRFKAQAAACGVKNGYANSQQLGSDRWAAVVAAWQRCRGPCVVAAAGTALTVDALSGDGEFLGGLIVPGLATMKQSLVAATAAISKIDGRLADFPDNTADAVHSGALRAMAGAIEAICDQLQAREGCMPICLVGGGDAAALLPALHRPAQITDNLVLQGLVLMVGGMA